MTPEAGEALLEKAKAASRAVKNLNLFGDYSEFRELDDAIRAAEESEPPTAFVEWCEMQGLNSLPVSKYWAGMHGDCWRAATRAAKEKE